MPSTIGKCKLFRIKHITLLEDETFLRNKHDIAFFEIKCTCFGRKENTIRSTKHLTFLRIASQITQIKYAFTLVNLRCVNWLRYFTFPPCSHDNINIIANHFDHAARTFFVLIVTFNAYKIWLVMWFFMECINSRN